MLQPPELQTEEFAPWSGGRGTDVWAMFIAAMSGDVETLRKLIAHDPKLVHCEYEYRKPLHFAVRENQFEAVRFLLVAGADATYKSGSKWHEAPLTIARDREYAGMVALLETWLAEHHKIAPQSNTVNEAIRRSDIQTVQQLLTTTPELLHAADERGNQPIHWAVMTRQPRLIDELLERGADINAQRPDGACPLDLTNGDYWYRGWRDAPASAVRSPEVIMGYLLARGADYDISNAAKIGDLERVRELAEQNPALLNAVPAYSTYYSGLPLRCAAGAGHKEVVKFLLERGANPNGSEPIAPQGHALYSAVRNKHFEIAQLLLEHGADPNAAVESSGNVMSAARDAGPKMVELIASYGGALTVELCCYYGDVPALSAMLLANPGLPITANDFQYACSEGQEAILHLLRLAQPDLLQRMRFTGAKTAELARELLEAGLDPRLPNWLGVTPLHTFAMNGDIAMAGLCLEFGASLDALDEEYRSTPLGWAARQGQREMVEFLLQAGANPHLPDDAPWATPLAWAQKRGHFETAALLCGA